MRRKTRIYNTGRHLPRATVGDWFELQQHRNRLVRQPIIQQSRKDKTVLYGGHALNRLMGKGYQRTTYDYDIYSTMPKHHAIQLEQSIDRGVNADLAYVERTSYPHGRVQKPLFRVKLHHMDIVEADYNTMPQDISYVVRDGVRYETLTRARDKYRVMNTTRGVNRTSYGELDRIRTYKILKKNRRRRLL